METSTENTVDWDVRCADSLGYTVSMGAGFNRRVIIGKCPYDVGTKEYEAYMQGSMRAREVARLENESLKESVL